MKIAEKLSQAPSTGKMHAYMQEIRRGVNEALQTKEYQERKTDAANPYIAFLQITSFALIAEAEGLDEMRAAGEKANREYRHEISYGGLANALDRAIYQYEGFQKDALCGKLFWMIMHPEKNWASILGHTKRYGANYNSFEHGNANVAIGAYSIGKARLHFNLGPTTSCDHLHEAMLQYLENRGNKDVYFQVDHEFEGQAGEAERKKIKREVAQNSSRLLYASMPLDGEIMKGKGEFAHLKTAKEFHGKLYNKGRMVYSFETPLPLAVDAKEVVEISERLFCELEHSLYWRTLAASGKAGTAILNKAQLIGFESLFAVKGILTLSEEERNCYFSQACKQNIDRGILTNVATLLLLDILTERKMDKERIDELVGIVLTRAGMVDDRRILLKRFEGLSAFLHLIHSNPEAFKKAALSLKK